MNDQLTEELIPIEIDIDDDVLIRLALEAHEKDITLNQHIINILTNELNHLQMNKE